MSRSGYSDDGDQWAMIMWRGAVESAVRGKRGQAFLKEMLRALDDLQERKLVAEQLEAGGDVCAIGAVGKSRGVDMKAIDAHDPDTVAGAFGIAKALAAEIAFMNDEGGPYNETPEARYSRMKRWVADQIPTQPEQ